MRAGVRSPARFLVLAWALLVLAPPLQESLASLPAGFRLAGSAVRSVTTMNPVVALRLLSGAGHLQTPEPESP